MVDGEDALPMATSVCDFMGVHCQMYSPSERVSLRCLPHRRLPPIGSHALDTIM